MLINSPNISGSLKVTGNTVITGSLTVLGGINATLTGSATTASYVEYSNVANKPALISSSAQIIGYGIFATTGSNQFNGSQAITGSLTVTGQVVAQTLNVQQVTSSIVYSSGSNIFGNSLGNTQQFTGSVSVTGSLTVTTNGTELQVTSTGVNLGNALTDSHIISGSLRINPNGLFVSGSGVVGIGTSTPTERFNVNVGGGARAGMALTGEYPYFKFNVTASSANSRNWAFSATNLEPGDFALLQSNAKDGDPVTAGTSILGFGRTGAATFSGSMTANSTISGYYGSITTGQSPASSSTSPNNPMLNLTNNRGVGLFVGGQHASPFGIWLQVSDTSNLSVNYPLLLQPNGGNVGIGTASPGANLDVQRVAGDSNDILRLGSNQNYYFGFSRNTSNGALQIQGNQTGYNNISFAPTSGNVGIGTTAPQSKLQINSPGSTLGLTGDAALRIAGGTFGTDQIVFGYSETGGYSPAVFGYIATTATGYQYGDLFFATRSVTTNTAPTERMRITSGGNVGIGETNPGSKLHVNGNTFTNGRFGMDFGSIRTYSALGNITINVGNLPVLDGNNWRQASIMVFYSGVSGGLELGYHNVTFIRLRGLTSWNDLNVTNIVGSASISLSNNTTTGCTLTLNVNSIITGSAMAMLASGTSGQLS